MFELFTDNETPMSDQILEQMRKQNFSPENIEYARIQMKEKKDLTFAMNMVHTLTIMYIADRNELRSIT